MVLLCLFVAENVCSLKLLGEDTSIGSQCIGTYIVPSVRSLVVYKQRIKPVASALSYLQFFDALDWMTRSVSGTKSQCHLSAKVLFWNE